jgi:phosphatidylglycerol:prolipoprotein diacylglycerol transferase
VIPYIEHPTLDLGIYELKAFSVLVVIAIVVQFQITIRRAPRVGVDRATASSLLGWAIGLGLVGAHVFDALAYYPERLADDPLYLLRIWDGLSSFGGMLGGLIGLYVVMRRRRMTSAQIVGFFDCLIFALPFTLAIGRLGCALQHDHPGVASTHPLAVAYPGGSRFDLGTLEFLYLSVVCIAFALLARRRWPSGFYVGLFFALYGPVRFLMDALRVADARYLGWTPAQYLSLAATVVGLAGLWAAFRRGGAAVLAGDRAAD